MEPFEIIGIGCRYNFSQPVAPLPPFDPSSADPNINHMFEDVSFKDFLHLLEASYMRKGVIPRYLMRNEIGWEYAGQTDVKDNIVGSKKVTFFKLKGHEKYLFTVEGTSSLRSAIGSNIAHQFNENTDIINGVRKACQDFEQSRHVKLQYGLAHSGGLPIMRAVIKSNDFNQVVGLGLNPQDPNADFKRIININAPRDLLTHFTLLSKQNQCYTIPGHGSHSIKSNLKYQNLAWDNIIPGYHPACQMPSSVDLNIPASAAGGPDNQPSAPVGISSYVQQKLSADMALYSQNPLASGLLRVVYDQNGKSIGLITEASFQEIRQNALRGLGRADLPETAQNPLQQGASAGETPVPHTDEASIPKSKPNVINFNPPTVRIPPPAREPSIFDHIHFGFSSNPNLAFQIGVTVNNGGQVSGSVEIGAAIVAVKDLIRSVFGRTTTSEEMQEAINRGNKLNDKVTKFEGLNKELQDTISSFSDKDTPDDRIHKINFILNKLDQIAFLIGRNEGKKSDRGILYWAKKAFNKTTHDKRKKYEKAGILNYVQKEKMATFHKNIEDHLIPDFKKLLSNINSSKTNFNKELALAVKDKGILELNKQFERLESAAKGMETAEGPVNEANFKEALAGVGKTKDQMLKQIDERINQTSDPVAKAKLQNFKQSVVDRTSSLENRTYRYQKIYAEYERYKSCIEKDILSKLEQNQDFASDWDKMTESKSRLYLQINELRSQSPNCPFGDDLNKMKDNVSVLYQGIYLAKQDKNIAKALKQFCDKEEAIQNKERSNADIDINEHSRDLAEAGLLNNSLTALISDRIGQTSDPDQKVKLEAFKKNILDRNSSLINRDERYNKILSEYQEFCEKANQLISLLAANKSDETLSSALNEIENRLKSHIGEISKDNPHFAKLSFMMEDVSVRHDELAFCRKSGEEQSAELSGLRSKASESKSAAAEFHKKSLIHTLQLTTKEQYGKAAAYVQEWFAGLSGTQDYEGILGQLKLMADCFLTAVAKTADSAGRINPDAVIGQLDDAIEKLSSKDDKGASAENPVTEKEAAKKVKLDELKVIAADLTYFSDESTDEKAMSRYKACHSTPSQTGNPKWLTLMSQCAASTLRWEEAEDYLEQAWKLNPEDKFTNSAIEKIVYDKYRLATCGLELFQLMTSEQMSRFLSGKDCHLPAKLLKVLHAMSSIGGHRSF